jgi:hypothetical protein
MRPENWEKFAVFKTLPKGHLSCLSKSFRYTPAAGTNLAGTFERIKRALSGQEVHGCASPAPVERLLDRVVVCRERKNCDRQLLLAGSFQVKATNNRRQHHHCHGKPRDCSSAP